MHRKGNPNLEILETVVARLGPLADEMVFLGGCATGLLLTDPAAPPVRFTQDVDVITEVISLAHYHRLGERLRARGFREDQRPEAPICRWSVDEVLLDVMPTDAKILGFGNPWYPVAMNSAERVELPSGTAIRMITAPLFLATKLAAFAGRGRGDYMASHDLEDVVAVLDGRPELLDELAQAPDEIRRFLSMEFQRLSKSARFIDALPGHLPGDPSSQDRLPIVGERIRRIARLT